MRRFEPESAQLDTKSDTNLRVSYMCSQCSRSYNSTLVRWTQVLLWRMRSKWWGWTTGVVSAELEWGGRFADRPFAGGLVAARCGVVGRFWMTVYGRMADQVGGS